MQGKRVGIDHDERLRLMSAPRLCLTKLFSSKEPIHIWVAGYTWLCPPVRFAIPSTLYTWPKHKRALTPQNSPLQQVLCQKAVLTTTSYVDVSQPLHQLAGRKLIIKANSDYNFSFTNEPASTLFLFLFCFFW